MPQLWTLRTTSPGTGFGAWRVDDAHLVLLLEGRGFHIGLSPNFGLPNFINLSRDSLFKSF